jgi:hypothetical protein
MRGIAIIFGPFGLIHQTLQPLLVHQACHHYFRLPMLQVQKYARARFVKEVYKPKFDLMKV